jgi:hypothetical protein
LKSVTTLYDEFYKDIGFDRAPLFEHIRNNYVPRTVLYPGSSIHITPSFYFQHVVYIDISNLSQQFFEKINDVYDLINSYKTTKQRHHIDYLNLDFTQPLPLRGQSYDLIISLFSGNQIQYCERYLKPNGIVLTTSLFSDDDYLSHLDQFRLIESFMIKKGKIVVMQKRNRTNNSKLKREGNRFIYQDNEVYYIYQKHK